MIPRRNKISSQRIAKWMASYSKRKKTEENGIALRAPLCNASDLEENKQEENKHVNHITPFTAGSYDAYIAATINAALNSAPVPLAFMLLKTVDELPLYYSLPFLSGLWILAGCVDFWSEYYIVIERLTPEFGLELEAECVFPKKTGTLYFFAVQEEKSQTKTARYTILIEDKDGSIVQEIGMLDELDQELQKKLYEGKFTELTEEDSVALKKEIARLYPHHKPVLQPDEDFSPGTRRDPWFFPLCVFSELPTFCAGMIFGYTLIESLDERIKIGLGIFFGLVNWLKNILIEMPIIANAYAKYSVRGNKMGPVEDQPGTWLVLNRFMLWALKDIAPAALAILTVYEILSAKTIPLALWVKAIIALPLYLFSLSTTLVFTMYALLQLNLKPELAEVVTLHHSLAKEENSIPSRILGEILGCRATTISFFLQLGFSPSVVAFMLTFMNALASIVLVYDPTVDISPTVLTFLLKNSPNANTSSAGIAAIVFLMLVQVYGAILIAYSQYPNYLAVVEKRQEEMGKPKKYETPEIRASFSSEPEQQQQINHPPVTIAKRSDGQPVPTSKVPDCKFADHLSDDGRIYRSHFHSLFGYEALTASSSSNSVASTTSVSDTPSPIHF